MKETDPFNPELKISLGNKLALDFNSLAEVTAWVVEEQKFYANVMPAAAGQDGAVANAWNQINGWFNQYTQRRQNHLSNAQSTPQGARSFIDEILNRYTGGALIYSQSTWGRYVAQLAMAEPPLAARVLILLGNINFPMQQVGVGHLWLRAGVIAEGLRQGWIDERPAANESLDHFRQQWEFKLQGLEDESRKRVVASGAILESLSEEKKLWDKHLADYAKQSAESLNKARLDTDEAIQKGVTDIQHFQNTYNAELALRAPNQYWHDKGVNHRRAAFAWLAAFAIIGALGLIGCWFVWHETVESVGKDATYIGYLPTIGFAVLVAWCLRICSRRALSNFTLSGDAGERVAMVKTYLALAEGGHASEAERGLVLASLFRPSTSVADDAAPASLFDLITKQK